MCPSPVWFLLLPDSALPVYVGLVDKICVIFQVSAVVLDQMTVFLRFLPPAVLLVNCHCWNHPWKWLFEIACRTVSESSLFYTESTSVWFLDLSSKPTFPVLLWPSRSLAVSNRRTSLLVLVFKQPGHGLGGDPPRAAVLPLTSLACSSVRETEHAGNLRNDTSSAFAEDFWDLSPCFPLFDVRRDNLDAHNIEPNFPSFDDKNTQNLCSSLNIAIQSCFDYFTCFGQIAWVWSATYWKCLVPLTKPLKITNRS